MSRQTDQLTAFAQAKLDALEGLNRRRRLTPMARGVGASVVRDGRMLVSFCDNDYLGLSQDPRVIAAAGASAIRHGAGSGGSRLIGGNNPLNDELETAIARAKGFPAARVFGSGYLANLGVVPAIVGRGDIVVLDELSHACMVAGARLSGADVRLFAHNDVADARDKLTADRGEGRALLMTETVFSMDGDIAPLADLAQVCDEANAWMMTDDAHGFGVVRIDNPAPIQMGTLSKSVGVYGGYVCGPQALMDLLISRARPFVYTTGLPPQVLGAALEAVSIIASDATLGPNVMAKARLFTDAMGLPPAQSAIVPIIIGDEARALELSQRLLEDGFQITAIRPPTVPVGTSRLRIAFSATHEDDEVLRLAERLKALLAERPLEAAG